MKKLRGGRRGRAGREENKYQRGAGKERGRRKFSKSTRSME
jgi:hypothetical protein